MWGSALTLRRLFNNEVRGFLMGSETTRLLSARIEPILYKENHSSSESLTPNPLQEGVSLPVPGYSEATVVLDKHNL